MKYRMLLIILLVPFLMGTIHSQEDIFDLYDIRETGNDSLIIQRKNGQKIKVIWDFRRNINKSVHWEELYDSFAKDLKKVSDNIPDFDFYKIDYTQNQKLIIDEVSGRETYVVREGDDIKYTKSNTCVLTGKDSRIIIEFNDFEELMDESLKADIKQAAESVKNTFYISYITRNRHYYSMEEAKMMKAPGSKLSLVFPLGARIGMTLNKPYIEARPGIGLKIRDREILSLNADFVFRHSPITNTTQTETYLGLNSMSIGPGFGGEVAVRIRRGIEDFDDLKYRFSFNYKTSSNINLGFHYFLRGNDSLVEDDSSLPVAFHIGYGF